MDFGFYTLYNLAGRSTLGDFLIVFFANYFPFVVMLVVAGFMAQSWRKGNISKTYPYIMAVIAGFVGRGVAEVFHFFYHRPRPFVAFNIPHLLTETSYSFPSGHTIFFFSLAMATYLFNKKFGYFLFGAGLVIGLARVAAGVHYPTDIAGGIVLGIFTGAIVYKLWAHFFAKNKQSSL